MALARSFPREQRMDIVCGPLLLIGERYFGEGAGTNFAPLLGCSFGLLFCGRARNRFAKTDGLFRLKSSLSLSFCATVLNSGHQTQHLPLAQQPKGKPINCHFRFRSPSSPLCSRPKAISHPKFWGVAERESKDDRDRDRCENGTCELWAASESQMSESVEVVRGD